MKPSPPSLAAAIAAGLALGVVTQLLQGILPGALNWIANSLSGWLRRRVPRRVADARLAGGRGAPARCSWPPPWRATTRRSRCGSATGWAARPWSSGASAPSPAASCSGRPAGGGGTARAACAARRRGCSPRCSWPRASTSWRSCRTRPSAAAPWRSAWSCPPSWAGTRRERGWAYLALVPGLLLGAAGYAATLALQGAISGDLTPLRLQPDRRLVQPRRAPRRGATPGVIPSQESPTFASTVSGTDSGSASSIASRSTGTRRSTSSRGASSSSSSCDGQQQPGPEPAVAERRVEPDHRDLHDVGGRALDRHVDRHPLAGRLSARLDDVSSGICRLRPSSVAT